ncbi:lipopolysaccharide biosynthesis protein [Streptococcus parauberis]|uniref:lipopolysaccharide biosynthesis protein n=1 Tax=Streptococcus parauberis TaxID=1348 RepID=UPI000789B9A3|nr:hypothetical protein [Streptococcus parauberis]KYP20848.1 hypothetical protein AKL13_00470 [Streptococcus parauberis]KYP21232.1 hypothetical protein TN39_00393 [Streptococcus parauberis]KYP22372.1 hypothetical protein AKL14_00369 [Streptococcus parauberis]KYP24891.1 hypothetical protein ADO04_01177 [Streptococcus parauberis]KYP25868.1 hypothetical protein TP84_01246 [Streptococcus parauberis]
MNLLKKIINVGFANIFQVFSGIILGFIIPKVLTIESYADFKTYTLFAGYIGMLHFGFVDGLYVDYGGKNLGQLDKNRLRSELVFFLAIQVILSLLLLIFSFYFQNLISILLAFTILPYNLNMYLKRIYQSTDNLKLYSKCLVLFSLISGLISLFFALIVKSNSILPYCAATIIAYWVVIISELKRINIYFNNGKIQFEFERYFLILKSGFIILLGNLAVNFFYGIDRWIVKIFFSTNEFSYYSFAVSMLNIVTTILQAISISMFSHFAKSNYKQKLTEIRELILVIGTFSSFLYFVLDIIVKQILPEYISSLEIISISMAIFPFMLYINAVTINIYKLEHKEKRYLTVMVLILLLLVLVDLLVLRLNNYNAIAWATLACYIIWYIFSRFESGNIDFIYPKEISYLSMMTISYLVLSHNGGIFSGIAYLIIWILSSLIFSWKKIKKYLKMYKNI